jgi:hypothetical protein
MRQFLTEVFGSREKAAARQGRRQARLTKEALEDRLLPAWFGAPPGTTPVPTNAEQITPGPVTASTTKAAEARSTCLSPAGQQARRNRPSTVFYALLLIIVTVSAYDTYLNIKYPITSNTELNPVAKGILQASNEDLALLIALKLFGTCVAVVVLKTYYLYNRKCAYLATVALTILQLAVAVFLTWC